MGPYDIHFNDDVFSNNKGFRMEFETALLYIETGLASGGGYFDDYKGGTVSIVDTETGDTVYEVEIN